MYGDMVLSFSKDWQNKGGLNLKKRLIGILTTVSVLALAAVPAFAEEVPLSQSISDSLEPVKSDAISALAAVAPIGIAILGGFLVWRYGIRFFKGLAK